MRSSACGWFAFLVFLAMPGVATNPSAGPVPLFTSITAYQPDPPIAGAHGVWRVELNHEAIRQPAGSVSANVPTLPAFVQQLRYWSPREGFIEAPNPKHPLGMNQIPFPGAPLEAFSWSWSSGNGLSLTVHEGIVAGQVSLGPRWFYISPRVGMTLLYEPSGSAGPPQATPVTVANGAFLAALGIMMFLLAGLALAGQRPGRTPESW
jgi:hypothetical protein